MTETLHPISEIADLADVADLVPLHPESTWCWDLMSRQRVGRFVLLASWDGRMSYSFHDNEDEAFKLLVQIVNDGFHDWPSYVVDQKNRTVAVIEGVQDLK